MKEAFAVTGFVATDSIKSLSQKGDGTIDVKPERGIDDVVMRVQLAHVAEVRTGSAARGETLVQLILQDNATVETVVRSKLTKQGITRIQDPALARLTAAAIPNKIMV